MNIRLPGGYRDTGTPPSDRNRFLIRRVGVPRLPAVAPEDSIKTGNGSSYSQRSQLHVLHLSVRVVVIDKNRIVSTVHNSFYSSLRICVRISRPTTRERNNVDASFWPLASCTHAYVRERFLVRFALRSWVLRRFRRFINSSAAKTYFAYVADSQIGQISGYSIDPDSGALTPLAGFPSAVRPQSHLHHARLSKQVCGRRRYSGQHAPCICR